MKNHPFGNCSDQLFMVLCWGWLCVVINHVIMSKQVHLVGGIPTPLKNMSSSLGMIIPNILLRRVHHHSWSDSISSWSHAMAQGVLAE